MATILLALIVTVPAAGDERAMSLLQDWIRAVDEHAVGEADLALSRITAWTYDDLETMRAYVEALAEVPNTDRARERRRSTISRNDLASIAQSTKLLTLKGDFDGFRKRAALLHTDAVLLGNVPVVSVEPPTTIMRKPGWAREPTERKVYVMSKDGRVENFELANLHWDLAMDMLDSLPAKPRPDPMVALWYRTVGAHFALKRRFADALPHFARARRVVPDDANVLFGEACLQETIGAPRVQEYVRITTLPNGFFFQGVSSPRTHLSRAESLLRRALEIDPGFVEARLRLGRVIAEQKRHEEALPYLQRVIDESTVRPLSFYAQLFVGDATQALGRFEEARLSYERAVELYSHSQSARLGLGLALRSTGDRTAALAAVLPTLQERANSRDGEDDPWWDYYDGDAANLSALMDQLRAPFLGGRR